MIDNHESRANYERQVKIQEGLILLTLSVIIHMRLSSRTLHWRASRVKGKKEP